MTGLLRSELLADVTVIVAGVTGVAGEPEPEPGLTDPLAALGARVMPFAPELDEAGEGGAAWVAAQPGVTALVFDARPAWTAGAGGVGIDRLSESLAAAWVACAAVANGAFIPSGQGGRIVLIAPGPWAGELAVAAADALENLARTLSIEWARFDITTTAVVAPASGGDDDDAGLATLVAFLLSKAGGYFSGGRLELGGQAG